MKRLSHRTMGVVFGAAAILLQAMPVAAQSTSGEHGRPTLPQRPDDSLVPAEKMPGHMPKESGSSNQPGNLSRDLDQSGGILSPPPAGKTDPDMQVVPPDPGSGSTPVIPPPGTPGGKPGIQPK